MDKQKQELQIKELKSNRSLAILGIVITSVILFFLGIFTLVCLTWRVSSKLGAVDYLLIVACFFVLFLLILCIRAVFKASVKLEKFLRVEDEQNVSETQTRLNVLKQKIIY